MIAKSVLTGKDVDNNMILDSKTLQQIKDRIKKVSYGK